MTDKVKQMAPVIWAEIEKAKKILLHIHPGPDGDTIGAAMATKLVLEKIGKDVTVISGDSEPPMWATKMAGFDQVKRQNYLETDTASFDLFLIIDSSSPDMISKRGEVRFPETMTTVVIDHHTSNLLFGKINLVDPTYPAICQTLADLFTAWNLEITPEAAKWLFLGIYTDSGFKYPLVTSDTFTIAARLAGLYTNFPQTIFDLENSLEPQHLAYVSLALGSAKAYFSGKVALAAVSFEALAEKGIKETHTEKMEISNFLKAVVGWNIGAALAEVAKNTITVSLRTRDSQKFDVSKIAVALGGGGHPAAAGATINKPFSEAVDFFLQTVAKVYPELGKP